MTAEDPVGGGDDLAGLPVDAAVERTLDRDDDHDPETVRAVLEAVAVDSVVTWDGVRDALEDASTVVSAPQTRVDLAETELVEARERASDVDNLGAVNARLEELEDRLDTVTERVADLGSQLDAVVDRADAGVDLFGVAADVQRLESAANELQGEADDLERDVEAVQRWLANPAVRYDELAGDLDAVEESVENLERTVDALSSAAESGDPGGALPADVEDVGALWFGAVLEHRTHQFMVEDVRVELSELREWADRENGTDTDRLAEIAERLEGLAERIEAVGDDLDAVARPGWIERFAEDIATYARDLDRLDQPADWSEVDRLLGERQAAVE
jgi:predicted  nucleic acid-binding Zn-ribbon protein